LRNAYYADNRDLVKWGVLLYLADEFDLARILQVAYLRGTTWGDLEVDGRLVPLPESVHAHFRDVRSASRMVDAPRIDVLDAPFEDRQDYTRCIVEAIGNRTDGERCLVFLDPDTGLEPAHPDAKHVLESELREVWQAMSPGDLLTLYQHQTNRSGNPWAEPKRLQLETALGLPAGSAKIAQGPSIARDVVFLYCPR
jgi:hypothetical protein